MKKKNYKFEKTLIKSIWIFILFISIITLSCSKDKKSNSNFFIPFGLGTDITSFSFLAANNPSLTSDIHTTIEEHEDEYYCFDETYMVQYGAITANVPEYIDKESLVANFETNGIDVEIWDEKQCSGITVNDFTYTLTYTVYSFNGSWKEYEVFVYDLSDEDKEMTSFSFKKEYNSSLVEDCIGEINGTEITVHVPSSASNEYLAASFTYKGNRVTVNGKVQRSGESYNYFSDPVTYRVIAGNGSWQDYVVNVIVVYSDEKDITSFSFESDNNTSLVSNYIGEINDFNINVFVPTSADLTSLIASFDTTGESVTIDDVIQTSGESVNDFSSVKTYKVLAENGAHQDYTVTVTPSAQVSKELTSFSFNIAENSSLYADMPGELNNTQITVHVPFDAGINSLIASFTTTGESVTVNGANQISGGTINDFSTPINYRVTAPDGSYLDYTVTVKEVVRFLWAESLVAEYSPIGNAITSDSNGNIYITGSFTGTVDFDPSDGVDTHTALSSNNLFVTRFNSDGSYEWTKTIVDDSYVSGDNVIIDDNGNIFLTGFFSGDLVDFDPSDGVDEHECQGYLDEFITKFNNDGSYGWTRTFPSTDYIYGINADTDSSGNFYLTGYFYGTVDFDPSPGEDIRQSSYGCDSYLLKINSDGTYGWTRTMGGENGSIKSRAIVLDESGNIYLAGDFRNTVDFDPDGSSDIFYNDSWEDMFISKIDNGGTYSWTRRLEGKDGNSFSIGNALAYNPVNNNIYVAGYFFDTADFDLGLGTEYIQSGGAYDAFVMSIDGNGNRVEYRIIRGTDACWHTKARSIAIDSNSHIYISGTLYGSADFDTGTGTDMVTSENIEQMFVTRISNTGDYGMTVLLPTAPFFSYDNKKLITVQNNGHIFTTGIFSGTKDFDPSSAVYELTSQGSSNVFISGYRFY